MGVVTYLYIGIAGALGTVCRMLLSHLLPSNSTGFPWGTLSCNLLGCLLLGYFSIRLARSLSERVRLMITTGFIGAFTTFSAFSIETILLFEADKLVLAFIYVTVSLIGGMTLAFVGVRFAELGKLKREQS